MSPPASAAKEALEEAGVRGAVDDAALGTYQYQKWRGICTIQVFAMEVEEEVPDWPEAGMRRREWMTLDQARRRIHEADLRQLLDRFIGGL